jgi:hypothetical protein
MRICRGRWQGCLSRTRVSPVRFGLKAVREKGGKQQRENEVSQQLVNEGVGQRLQFEMNDILIREFSSEDKSAHRTHDMIMFSIEGTIILRGNKSDQFVDRSDRQSCQHLDMSCEARPGQHQNTEQVFPKDTSHSNAN